ncbi:MAG: hypothetical protein GEV09_25850 [Pseudonocardiaceae bacterium]|nr:hypothetical protein [Pseudonocardiaceae bacterium]
MAPYSEATHRAELKEMLGHEVGDWPQLGAVRDTCVDDEREFAATTAALLRGEYGDRWHLSIKHVCRERLGEVAMVAERPARTAP